MRIWIYDCEVFKHDWLIVFKDITTKGNNEFNCSNQYILIGNDNDKLKEFINEDDVYVGFNSKHYDQFIIKGICAGFTHEQLKHLNDYIISGNQGWSYPPLKGFFFKFNNVDIRDDCQQGLSLKVIEGHMGMNIEETDVSFDIDRPLTDEEMKLTIKYCKHDVDATHELFKLRLNYLQNKINLGKLAGLSEAKALSMTNAKLTSAMLQATPQEHNDERQYEFPNNLKGEYIPIEVFEFFNRMYDSNLTDEEVFKSKYEFNIGECEVRLGFGGIHGAIPHYSWEEDGVRAIINEDVGSYYPHLCTINGYTSRNIPDPKIYSDVLDDRMAAKADGDIVKANALKLVCNTTYGAMLNKYNDLYDPLMGRSVCISGQLYLLELALHLSQDIKNLKIVQLNTDGIMVELDIKDIPILENICNEWQERTKFELERDDLARLYQKDVNNYIEVQKNGKVKSKGGYLVKGIAKAGAFNINNSCVIVATALKEYFINKVPVEDTINNATDIFDFQIIAKAGAKYKEAYHIIDNQKFPIQKVNRIYATSDERFGKIYKVKAEDDSEAKIESLPEHCIVDNRNELRIEDIDRSFYVEMARKRVNDFLGVENPKDKKDKRGKTKMATTKKVEPKEVIKTSATLWERILKARLLFNESEISKSGKNPTIRYTYFELADIVPVANKCYEQARIVPITYFDNEYAYAKVVNIDKPEEIEVFKVPLKILPPIVSNAGKEVINIVQGVGSTITYYRRYLDMLILDVVENDNIDSGAYSGTPVTPPTPKVPSIDMNQLQPSTQATVPLPPTTPPTPAKPPVVPLAPVVVDKKPIPPTPAERTEIKENITATDTMASAIEIKGLKNLLHKLETLDPKQKDFCAHVALMTHGFEQVNRADCAKITAEVNKCLAKIEKGGAQ